MEIDTPLPSISSPTHTRNTRRPEETETGTTLPTPGPNPPFLRSGLPISGGREPFAKVARCTAMHSKTKEGFMGSLSEENSQGVNRKKITGL